MIAAIFRRAKKSSGKKDKKARIKVLGKISVSPEAEIAINAFIQATVASGVEGIRKEFQDVKNYAPKDGAHEKFLANPDRKLLH